MSDEITRVAYLQQLSMIFSFPIKELDKNQIENKISSTWKGQNVDQIQVFLERDWIRNRDMQDYNRREKLAIVLRRLRMKLLTFLEPEAYLAAKIAYQSCVYECYSLVSMSIYFDVWTYFNLISSELKIKEWILSDVIVSIVSMQ